jgi:hypothetical protein
MSPFRNSQVNLLIVHSTLHRLAWNGSGLFSGVFMLQRGVPAPIVFLAFAGVLFLRYAFRPLVIAIVPRIGLKNALMLGTLFQAAQYPLLAAIDRVGLLLCLYVVAAALAGMIYYTCYHFAFAVAGDVSARGRQVATRQVLVITAGIVGPAVGGLLLSVGGPWIAFATAMAIELAAIVPLVAVKIATPAWPSNLRPGLAMNTGVLLFATDGWINNGSGIAWNIVMFQALGSRFDAFGLTTAAAALAGAVGGMIQGHVIDLGHGSRAARLSAVMLVGILLVKAFCGDDAYVVTTVAIGSYVLGGLYTPSLMTAFYNEAKRSLDPLRFQIAAEGGWDLGAGVVNLIAAALCALGASFHALILLALPAVLLQTWVLERSYAASRPT